MLSEPVFNVLRSKQQLGYSVSSSVRLTHGVLGFAIVIVSGGRQLPQPQLHTHLSVQGLRNAAGSCSMPERQPACASACRHRICCKCV